MIEILFPIGLLAGTFYVTNIYANSNPKKRNRQNLNDQFEVNSFDPTIIEQMFKVVRGPKNPPSLGVWRAGTPAVTMDVKGVQQMANVAKEAQQINTETFTHNWDPQLLPTGARDNVIHYIPADDRIGGKPEGKALRSVVVSTTTVAGRASNASLM